MTLIQLRYLVAVVDAGLNVTAAAKRVNATQPGLSKQLAQMEAELGQPLFTRRGRSFDRLTAAGAEVVERARAILSEAAGIQALATRQGPAELRIATTHTQARFVLPGAVARLRQRIPDLRLHLFPAPEKEALQQFERDEADLALVSGVEPPSTGHAVLPLYRWSLVGLCPPGRPLPRAPISLESLAETPLVTYESAMEAGSSIAQAFAEAGFTPCVACTARDSDLIKTYVRAGLGLGLLAEMAVLPEDADLAQLDLHGLFPPRTTWAVFRKDRASTRQVLELLTELAPGLASPAAREALLKGPEPSGWQPPIWS